MRTAIIGYGKMGKEVEKILLLSGYEIVTKIDNEDDWNTIEIENADVAIEFSTPDTVLNNIYKCFSFNIPIVVGTTGWYEKLEEVRSYAMTNKKSLFYASNFSIGVNLFFELNKKFLEISQFGTEFVRNTSIEEVHHIKKIDKPSGTAKTLTEIIKNNSQFNEVPITSIREGDIFGIHTVKYESNNDIIEIRHTAKSRSGFAQGAVDAAKFLIGKHGVFTMDDLLKQYL
ncbi:MAG: 4-hydroxy-tetrahydrodipicolinate reductase [Bacteroidales bacterium]|jgi:4-hydroxy-tetrahydrodipicolinate reductase|nr:4-hydroxy-tetrahydrodipicolinate reductase [Bacteroidales bacterium]